MFDPETDFDDLRSNIAFLKEADLMGHQPTDHLFNFLKLYPGTPARQGYIERFGLRSHHLSSINPPFVDARIATVFAIVNGFYGKYQARIDDDMVALDRVQRRRYAAPAGATAWERARLQEMAALMIRLRHITEHFFVTVVDGVEAGRIPEGATIDDVEELQELAAVRELLRRAGDLLRHDGAPLADAPLDGAPLDGAPLAETGERYPEAV
jgi:hypothetical protein